MTTYPITLTEVPHQGPRTTWTLYGSEHLAKCIESAERGGYSDWQAQEGRLIITEDDNGEVSFEDLGAYTLEAYIDWLRHDLSTLIIHEGEF